MITQNELKRVLRYVKSTGKFYWLVSPKPGVRIGDEAGCLNWKGYVVIGYAGRSYRAHRLAWLYVVGDLPTQQIDHKSHVKSDNSWRNLRLATNRLNQENQIKAPCSNRSSGLLGVTWNKRTCLWKAQIKSRGKNFNLGEYTSPQQAHRAYLKAKRRLHAGCTI